MRSLATTLMLVGGLLSTSTTALAAAADTDAPERPSSITPARYAAVSFALTMDIVTTSLGSTCAKANDELSATAEAALSSWRNRNGHFVDSAHKYLLFVKASVAAEKGEDAGNEFYEAQRKQFVADAAKAMTDSFPGGDIDEAGCEKVLDRLGDGGMDLQAKPELFQSLKEIDDAVTQMLER